MLILHLCGSSSHLSVLTHFSHKRGISLISLALITVILEESVREGVRKGEIPEEEAGGLVVSVTSGSLGHSWDEPEVVFSHEAT